MVRAFASTFDTVPLYATVPLFAVILCSSQLERPPGGGGGVASTKSDGGPKKERSPRQPLEPHTRRWRRQGSHGVCCYGSTKSVPRGGPSSRTPVGGVGKASTKSAVAVPRAF